MDGEIGLIVIILFIVACCSLFSYHMGWWSCDGFRLSYINQTGISERWIQKCA